jgi:hypothetical protein
MKEWLVERQAFDRLVPRLARRYAGRYVAIHRGRVVGSDADHEALFQRLWKELKGQTFYVGKIGGDTDLVQVPGFTTS